MSNDDFRPAIRAQDGERSKRVPHEGNARVTPLWA
jgi:hypothetical protein